MKQLCWLGTAVFLVGSSGLALASTSIQTTHPTELSITRQPLLLSQNGNQDVEPQNFGFWSEQCLSLRAEREYEQALKACNKAISLKQGSRDGEVWATRGDVLLHLGRLPEALTSYQRVIEIAPKNSLALTNQCAIFYQMEQYETALDTCDRALQINESWGNRAPSFTWYVRGLILRDMGRLETALASFRRSLTLEPSHALAIAEGCRLLDEVRDRNQQSQLRDANFPAQTCGQQPRLAAYEQALAQDSDNQLLLLQQGLALEQSREYQQALVAYTRLAELAPKSSAALVRQCSMLNQLKQYEAALQACQKALQGDRRWGWWGSSRLVRRCEVDRQSSSPTNWEICQQMPLRGTEPGQFGPALIWNQQSIALAGLGRYQEALASAERAIAIDPYYAAAYSSRAVSLWGLNQNRRALEAIDQAIGLYAQTEPLFAETFERVYPDSLASFYQGQLLAWFNKGRILAASGATADAIEIYKKAQEINQKAIIAGLPAADNALLADISLNLGVALLKDSEQQSQSDARMSKRQDALAATEKAISLMGQAGESYLPGLYNRGIIYLRMGNYVQAVQTYQAADQLKPNSVEILTGIAITYEEIARNCVSPETLDGLKIKGVPMEAIAAYDRVLAINPNYLPAKQRRSALLKELQGQVNRPFPKPQCSAT